MGTFGTKYCQTTISDFKNRALEILTILANGPHCKYCETLQQEGIVKLLELSCLTDKKVVKNKLFKMMRDLRGSYAVLDYAYLKQDLEALEI